MFGSAAPWPLRRPPHALERLMPVSQRATHDSVTPVVGFDHRIDDPSPFAAAAIHRRRGRAAGARASRACGTSAGSRSGAHSRAAQATSQTAEPGLARSKSISATARPSGEHDVVEVRVVVADRAVAESAPGRPAATRRATGRRRRRRRGTRAAARHADQRLVGQRPAGCGSIAASPGDIAERLAPVLVAAEEARRAVEPDPLQVHSSAPVAGDVVRHGRRTVSPTRHDLARVGVAAAQDHGSSASPIARWVTRLVTKPPRIAAATARALAAS